jgi:hypothetical protein
MFGLYIYGSITFTFLVVTITLYYIRDSRIDDVSLTTSTKTITVPSPSDPQVESDPENADDTDATFVLGKVLVGGTYLLDILRVQNKDMALNLTSMNPVQFEYNGSYALLRSDTTYTLYSTSTLLATPTIIHTFNKDTHHVCLTADSYVVTTMSSSTSSVQIDVYTQDNLDRTLTLETCHLYSRLPTTILFHKDVILVVFDHKEIYVASVAHPTQKQVYYLQDLNFQKAIHHVLSVQGYVFMMSNVSLYCDVFTTSNVDLKKAFTLNLPIVPRDAKILEGRLYILNDHSVYVYNSHDFTRCVSLFGSEIIVDISVYDKRLLISTSSARVIRKSVT